jgi:hypothetical protein
MVSNRLALAHKFPGSILVVFAILFAVSPARAEGERERPCKKLTAACEAGGYLPGQHSKGKGLHADCMKKLLDGGTVEGVSVSAAEVAACKAKKAKKGPKKSGTPLPSGGEGHAVE